MSGYWKRASCTSKSERHDTHSGAMRCPVHKHQARYSRNNISGINGAPKSFPDPIPSAVPKRGTVHEESLLPFSTGKKTRGGHHNVGQEMECLANMFEDTWEGTWFQDVIIKESEKGYHRFELESRSARHLSSGSLHLRDCSVGPSVRMRLAGRSSFVGGKGFTKGTYRHSAPDISATGTTRLEDLSGFSLVSVSDKASMKNVHATSLEVLNTATAEGCRASKWIRVNGQAQVTIDHPGQCISIDEDFSGTITQNVPALIVVREGWEDSQQRAITDNKFDVFAKLTRRKEDGSEGRYLHPHNHRAWEALVEMGGVVEAETKSHSAYRRQRAVEDILDIALDLHPNPA